MTKFVVHVGPHKTGTTYLQVTLDRLRHVLLERGICVPSIWNAAPGLPSHMKLARALQAHDLAQTYIEISQIVASNPKYVVISCEALSRLNPQQIVQLRLLRPSPAEVVYYLRRWPERLPSLWQETVKFGYTTSLPEFLTEQLAGSRSSEFLDLVMIDKFAAVFGESHIKIVLYSQLTDSGLDIAKHFFASFLELPDIELPALGRHNSSLAICTTELIRAMNVIHARHGGERSPQLRSWFLSQQKGLVPDVVLDAMQKNIGVVHLDESRAAR